MSSLTYRFANAICRTFLMPPYARVTVRGLQNIPLDGPLIIASNHLSDSDPGIIGTALPRAVTFMAKAELFRIPLLKQFLYAYGAFPVQRDEADLSALREARNVLGRGGALCIFPEGTASREKARLAEAWPGVGLIALRADAQVLPLALTGSQRMHAPFLFFRPWKRFQVTVTAGAPFRLPPAQRINTEAAQEATARIMERLAALLPEEYRGYYGDGMTSEVHENPPPAEGQW